MEFKNLAEVTKLDEAPEGASVLAATAEGEVVRVPGDGLGGGGKFAEFVYILDFNPVIGAPAFTGQCNVSFDEFKEILASRGIASVTVKNWIALEGKVVIEAATVTPRVGTVNTVDVLAADNFIVSSYNGLMSYFTSDGVIHDGNGDDPMDNGGAPV